MGNVKTGVLGKINKSPRTFDDFQKILPMRLMNVIVPSNKLLKMFW